MTIACEEMAREDDRRNGRISEAGDRSENEGDADDSAQDHLWRQYAGCLNDKLEGVNPLIGREEELELSVDAKARRLVKQKGISAEFGAREIERVIQSEIKPLLVDEILFGELKDGGRCSLTAVDERFVADGLCTH